MVKMGADRTCRRCIAGILVVAAALRIASVAEFGVSYDGGFFDAQWYLDSARVMAETGAFTLRGPELSAMMMPGFVWFLVPAVVLGQTFFGEYLLIKLAMLFLGLLTILLVYLIGVELGSPPTGLIAAGMLAATPAHIYAGNLPLTENLFGVLVLLFTLSLFRFRRTRSRVAAVASIAALCAGFYVRETMAVLALAGVSYLLVAGIPARKVAMWTGVASLVLVLALAPWWVRNHRLFGEFVPTTTGAGFPLFEGTFQTFHPYGTGSFEAMASLLDGFEGGEPERNRLLVSAAIDRMRTQWERHPLELLGRMCGTKPAAAWLLPFYWDEVLGLSSWWVARIHAATAALGLACLVWLGSARRAIAEYRFLLAAVALITVSAGLVLGLSRYAHPFMPFLYLAMAQVAMTGFRRLGDRMRARRTSRDTP